MGASDLVDYYQEVFNFTSSMSLKFTPMANAMNDVVLRRGFVVDLTDPTSWKYYLNLMGQYHPTDSLITIDSLDTQQPILFAPNVLALHPKTAAAYTPGQPAYQALCALHPEQTDLIKSIVYPAANVESLILAADFTILAYSSTFLEPAEYDHVLLTVEKFLAYICSRWYFPFFSYEPYYNWVFWGQLWQQIIGVVLLARITAIRTTAVHSWHVWQYLTSFGLADYRDILSRTQTMFLYRNMPYLIANRGKQTNLVTLADNLLSALGVGLYGRDVWQQTQDGFEQCQLVADLVPVGVPTRYINALPAESAESVGVMERRLYAMGAEVDVSDQHLEDLTLKFSSTTLNTMPTKLLELRQVSTDRKFSAFLNHFLLDSVVYAIAQGIYTTQISITEATTSTTLSLSTKEALVLYGYCAARSMLQTPITLPTTYVATAVFAQNPNVPTTMQFSGYMYPMHDFTNVANYLSTYAWPSVRLASPEEFSAVLSRQFLAAINQIQVSRLAEDALVSRALRLLTNAITVRKKIPLVLASQSTYTDWFAAQQPALQTMLATFDTLALAPSLYGDLADLILSNLMPATPTFSLYGNFAFTNTAYAKFKQLFIQLCSYNIEFLDNDTTVDTGVFIGKMESYTASRTITRSVDFPIETPLLMVHSAANSTTAEMFDTTIKINTHGVSVNHISGGINLSSTTQITGYHRMKIGSDFYPGRLTITDSNRVAYQTNDSTFLANKS